MHGGSWYWPNYCILPDFKFLFIYWGVKLFFEVTGISLSEVFILTSTNPQYDKRLFIDLPLQYMKLTKTKNKQFMYTTCSKLVVFMYWTGKSINNLLSYCCGLVDARISASEKDLPVPQLTQNNSSRIKGHTIAPSKNDFNPLCTLYVTYT